jgi:hypothetical protein
LGISPLVLGQQVKPWSNRAKFRLTAEALAQVTTPLVIGADSADVVFLDNPQLLVERFRQHFRCKLIFNATGSRCWPELPELTEFQTSLPMVPVVQGRHWINSGLFIGETKFAAKYFATLAKERPVAGFEGSDQAVVMRTWRDWYPEVQADYLCLLFQWFNESLQIMHLQRPQASRQKQLVEWYRNLAPPLLGVEVGVFRGETAESLLRELPQLTLWMIDPWKPYQGLSRLDSLEAKQWEEAMEAALLWTEFAQDRRGVLRETSLKGATRFSDGNLAFVHLDGDHRYPSIVSDLQAWWPKVRSGGQLTGHDYGVYGDKTGVWGVKQAVNEFAAHHDREVELGLDGTWRMIK